MLRAALALPVHDTDRATSVHQLWKGDPLASRASLQSEWDASKRYVLDKVAPVHAVLLEAEAAVADVENTRLATSRERERAQCTKQAHELNAVRVELLEMKELYESLLRSWSWRALKPLHKFLGRLRPSR